jgi:hypothetical protein
VYEIIVAPIRIILLLRVIYKYTKTLKRFSEHNTLSKVIVVESIIEQVGYNKLSYY